MVVFITICCMLLALTIRCFRNHRKYYILHFDGSHNNQANKSGAKLVKQEMSCSSNKKEDEGEGSSPARNIIGMAGAAVAGDQQEHNKSKAKGLPTNDFTTHNYVSTYHQNKTSNHHKYYIFHFDGSHKNQANKSGAGAGCIIRDNQGELVVAAAYNITETFPDSCNVAIAEAVALWIGLKLAKDYNVNLSVIKGDSKEVIDHVLSRSRRPPKPPLSGIIQEIVGMITSFSPKIELINREANKAADKLASWGSSTLSRGHHKIFRSYVELPQLAELVKQDMSWSSNKKEDEGEGSSTARNIGMAVAAVAGDKQEHNKTKAKVLPTNDFDTHNYVFTYLQNKTSNHRTPSVPQSLPHLTQKALTKSGVMGQRSGDGGSNYYILHFNGSDIYQYNKGGAGCIIRNKYGELVVAGAYNLDYLKQFHVAIGGAVALRNGLKLAKKNNVKLDLIKGKNEEVINRVRGRQKRPPEHKSLSKLITVIKKALRQQSIDPETQVKLIGEGESNEVAHELAYYGSTDLEFANEEIYSLEDDLPPEIAKLLQQDKKFWSPLKKKKKKKKDKKFWRIEDFVFKLFQKII